MRTLSTRTASDLKVGLDLSDAGFSQRFSGPKHVYSFAILDTATSKQLQQPQTCPSLHPSRATRVLETARGSSTITTDYTFLHIAVVVGSINNHNELPTTTRASRRRGSRNSISANVVRACQPRKASLSVDDHLKVARLKWDPSSKRLYVDRAGRSLRVVDTCSRSVSHNSKYVHSHKEACFASNRQSTHGPAHQALPNQTQVRRPHETSTDPQPAIPCRLHPVSLES